MKKFHLGILACAVMALVMAPGTGQTNLVVTAPSGVPDLIDFSAPSWSIPISCTFHCNDGYGYVLDPCNDGSLNACCANAEPACAGNGGLQSGICQQGRLGLPCQPL